MAALRFPERSSVPVPADVATAALIADWRGVTALSLPEFTLVSYVRRVRDSGRWVALCTGAAPTAACGKLGTIVRVRALASLGTVPDAETVPEVAAVPEPEVAPEAEVFGGGGRGSCRREAVDVEAGAVGVLIRGVDGLFPAVAFVRTKLFGTEFLVWLMLGKATVFPVVGTSLFKLSAVMPLSACVLSSTVLFCSDRVPAVAPVPSNTRG